MGHQVDVIVYSIDESRKSFLEEQLRSRTKIQIQSRPADVIYDTIINLHQGGRKDDRSIS